MERRSCVTDPSGLLVADTSVIINLNASRCAKDLLDALPNQVLVVEEVSQELERGRQFGWTNADALWALINSRRIAIVQLGEIGQGYFEKLVAGPATQTLDDGEAATIAYALETGATPLIDERKAHRICAERFPAMTVGCTGDLLAHDEVLHVLGREHLAEAVYNALRDGRMRVLPDFLAWTVELIGPDRATNCPSLPRSVRSQHRA